MQKTDTIPRAGESTNILSAGVEEWHEVHCPYCPADQPSQRKTKIAEHVLQAIKSGMLWRVPIERVKRAAIVD